MGGMTSLLSQNGSQSGLLGWGLSVASQVLGGLASQVESRSEADTDRANARYARQQAVNQAAREREKYRGLASTRKAAFGASGVDVNVGSPLDVLVDTDAEGATEVLDILHRGKREADSWKRKAALAERSGRRARGFGILGGVSRGLRGMGRW